MPSYGAVQLRYKRDRPSGQPAEDIAVNTLHCQVTDGGWTTDDRDTFNSAWQTWWTAIAAFVSSAVGPVEHRFYNVPATAGPYGAPAFVTTHSSQVGTGSPSAELPPQCAMSITMHTAARRHWGRIYLPGLVNGTVNTGRFLNTVCGTAGAAYETMLQTLRASGQGVVIWDRGAWIPHDTVDGRIDDVVDVQRRRRFDKAFFVRDMDFTP